MSNTNLGPASSVSINTTLSSDLGRDSDQRKWENLLSVNGAVFNGSSDDAPAIQASMNSLASDNGYHPVSFPGIGLTAAIGSTNICPYAGAVGGMPTGIQIPQGIGINMQEGAFAAVGNGIGAIGSGGAVVAIVGTGRARTLGLQNGSINGTFSTGYGLVLRNTTGNSGPAVGSLYRMRFNGAANCIWLESNAYIWSFDECELRPNQGNGFYTTTTGSNYGENINFNKCFIQSYSAGTAGILLNSPANQGITIKCNECSFDYCVQAISIISPNTGHSNIYLYGCHLETNLSQANYAASGASYINLGNNAAVSSLKMFGGDILIVNSGSGNSLAYVINPGNSGSAAPYGVVLNYVDRSVSGTGLPIVNAAATTRYLDNQ